MNFMVKSLFEKYFYTLINRKSTDFDLGLLKKELDD